MTKQPLERYLGHYLLGHPEDLSKMIFIAGPRQVGKTTLLENLGPKLGYKDILYLNWDRPKDRGMIRDAKYSAFSDLVANAKAKPLVVFDEIHKYPKWKSFLKGYFDTFRKQISTCVTGSARLDVYRCGGDSLFGRYWLLHFNPITVGELLDKETLLPPKEFITKPDSAVEEVFTSLAKWGGFPEPLFSGSDTQHRRWLKMRRERLVGEDLRDLSKIHDLSHVENLMDLVIASVGSTLSVNSLRESLGVSYNAVTTWLKWLEAIYYCFAISPYSKGVARGLKKERKYYLYDWSEVTDEGARFENIVAVHLKKSIDFWNDIGTGTFSFNYIRDLEKREVDFLVLRDKRPWMLVECKLNDEAMPKSLIRMSELLNPVHSVLVNSSTGEGKYRVIDGRKFLVTGAATFLSNFV